MIHLFDPFLQFYLDMEFVLLFSSQGRFLSRNLHQVIRDIIDRAVEAVEATGIDPYRYKYSASAMFFFFFVSELINLNFFQIYEIFF